MATIRPRVAVFHIHSLNHDWQTPSSLYQTASNRQLVPLSIRGAQIRLEIEQEKSVFRE
jgi:hypothetical protein